MIYFKNDKIITIFISLSALMGALVNFISPSIYKNLGFYKYNALCIFFNVINSLFIFIFGKQFPFLLLFSLIFVRFILNLNYAVSIFCLYGIFGPHIGLSLSQFFDYSFFVGFTLAIFFSNFFNISENFHLFIFFSGLEIIILGCFLYFFKDFEKKMKSL